MSSRIASSAVTFLVPFVVVLSLQPVAAALTFSDLCRQGAAESVALCQLRSFQKVPTAPPKALYDPVVQMRRPQRSGAIRVDQEDVEVKTDESEQSAPLRLAFWRYTRLHPREQRSSAASAAATSISKNGGKRGYDFIRFGRSPSSSHKTPLASYDFIRLGRK